MAPMMRFMKYLGIYKRCENCTYFMSEWDNAGLCKQLGILSKRGEYILDGIDIFDKLNVSRLEHRKPVVRNGFCCIYWKEKK